MTMLTILRGDHLRLHATSDGVYLTFVSAIARGETTDTWPTPDVLSSHERAVLTDFELLVEQALAHANSDGIFVSTADWVHGVELGAASLTSFTVPSHLMLQVDRVSELGRPDFRYLIRWLEGAREVAVERHGPYIRHLGTNRVMHLDRRSVTMLEAMERYNNLPEQERSATRAFAEFAAVRNEAAAAGALLDEYLASNTVLIPASIGLIIREHGDNSISFAPRVPDLADPAQLVDRFLLRADVPDVDTLTTSDGQRVRILFTDAQREVMRRMQRVRRIGGDEAGALREDPSLAFDGVIDAIDLADVQFEYGPRVIGVGPLSLPTEIRPPIGRGISDLLELGTSAVTSADAPLPPDIQPHDSAGAAEPQASHTDLAPRRIAVALDVLDEETGTTRTLRFDSTQQIAEFRKTVQQAINAGVSSVEHQGHRIRVEPALEEALAAHEFAGSSTTGTAGRSGHLYLLIDEHESSLTEALLVDEEVPEAALESLTTLPTSLRAEVVLQPHQLEGVDWLSRTMRTAGRRGGVLADDMGLGKTLQLLTHVAHLIESGALEEVRGQGPNGPWRPVLVVAPLLLVDSGTWTEEMRLRFREDGRVFEPWLVLRDSGLQKVRASGAGADLLGKPLLDPAKLMRHKVVITTYETLAAYQHSLAQRIDGKPLWTLVIFDEAQKVKSVKTKNSYVAKAIDAQRKVAATGTPVETRMLDLWSLLDTVEPTRFGTQRDFISRYERPAMNAVDASSRHDALQALRIALRYKRSDAFLLRRDKSLLTALPPKVEQRPRCAMTAEERSVHAEITQAMRQGGGPARALAGLQQLHLASQHPFLARGIDVSQHDGSALLSASSRLQYLVVLLHEIASRGEKALIFARSVPAQRMLAHVIGQEFRRRIEIVNGESVPGVSDRARGTAHRKRILDRFRTEPKFGALILSPFVAGIGLTLVEANHVIHYGRWWNPAVENQATDRAHRIGQTRPVHVYFPIAHDPSGAVRRSFDEALDELITTRRTLATDFLVPVSEVDTEGQLASRLVDSTSAGPLSNASDAGPDSRDDVARLLVALVRARGSRAAWLGTDGRHGADALIELDGSPTVVGVCEVADSTFQGRLTAAVSSWRRHLGAISPEPLIVARDPAAGSAPHIMSWAAIHSDASRMGISASAARIDVGADHDVDAVLRTFTS